MTAKTVLKMGTPSLWEPAKPIIEFGTADLYALIKDMKDTMAERGGVGLAAPQIGHAVRVIIFGFEHSVRYPNEKPVPFTILINPGIQFLTDKLVDGWEGCLSVPGLRGQVPRYTHLRYTGFDPEGHPIDRTVQGFHARIIQHECDHLDGILFPQRMANMKAFGFEDALIYS